MLWPMLGGVRFLLALIVAGDHLALFSPASKLSYTLKSLSSLAAVLGFLVISGFSIAASYAKEPQGFYWRRAIRIIPLYVLAIVAGAVCTRAFGGAVTDSHGDVFNTPPWSDVVQNLFFAQGFTAASIGTNMVVWSLSIEVLFYLFTPLLGWLSQAALVVIASTSLGLFLLYPLFPDAPYYANMRTGAAVSLLAWTWLSGFIAFRHGNHLVAGSVVLGVCVLALNVNPSFLQTHWLATLVIVVSAIGFGHRLKGPRWLASGLTLLGDASYPLYLFHMPVYLVLGGLHVQMSAVGCLLIAIGISVALDRFYDQPVKRLLTSLAKFRAQPIKDSIVPVTP
jgi:peptidoglycan/LPS O-acetylase OafA/YrhL